MKLRNLAFLSFILFTFIACDNTEAYFGGGGGSTNPGVFSRLSDIIKHDNVPTDSLSFNPQVDSSVQGSFGTEINIPANAVVRDEQPIPEELFVVLREYPSISKMGISNVQAESNQEMLVTGGNFWWKIVDADGNDWDIVQPSQITATQPIALAMGSFANVADYQIGNVINGGNQQVLNWTNAPNGEGNMSGANSFEYTGLQLFWANCGAVYDYPNGGTQFSATLNTNADLAPGQQMLLFIPNDFPGIVNIYARQGVNFVTQPGGIPLGISGTLIGIALNTDSNLLIGSTVVNIEGDDSFSVDLAPGDVNSLNGLIQQAAN